jgi:ABC-type lipoprotein export system ATPase subunit
MHTETASRSSLITEVTPPPLLQVSQVETDIGGSRILRGVNLEVRAGEVVALWGSSGSGKSTLLHLLGGLDTPDRGELSVCGLDPTLESNRLELRRRHLGFVFQLHNLIPDLTVEENIRIPALALGRPVAETAARVRDHEVWMDGQARAAAIYDRSKLRAGDVVAGPAVITEMNEPAAIPIASGCW